MFSDPNDKDQVETPSSVESQSSPEDATSKTEKAAASHLGSEKSAAVSEELLKEIVGLCRKQNDTITNLREQIAEQKTALEALTKDVDAQKIHEVQGTVKGKYDFAPSREKFNEIVRENNDEEAYAKSLYDKIKANNRMF